MGIRVSSWLGEDGFSLDCIVFGPKEVGEQGGTYLTADHDDAAVGGPGDCEAFTAELDCCDTFCAAGIPEFACAIAGYGGEFCFFRGVPCHPLYATCVSSELRAVLDLWLIWIPYAESTVS